MSTEKQPEAFFDGRLQLNLTIWILAGLSGALTGLRVWCKIRRHRGLWHDDWWLIASWVFSPHPDQSFLAKAVDEGLT